MVELDRSQCWSLIHLNNRYLIIYVLIRSNRFNPFLARWNISFLPDESFFIVDAFLLHAAVEKRRVIVYLVPAKAVDDIALPSSFRTFANAQLSPVALTVVRHTAENDS